MQTVTPSSDYLDRLVYCDFEHLEAETSESDQAAPEEPSKPIEEQVQAIPEVTKEQEISLAESMKPLEPIEFEEEEPINITMGDRPFQKKPFPKIVLGMGSALILAFGLGFMLIAGQNDAKRLIAKQSEAPEKGAVASSEVVPEDPKDKMIGQLRSDEASRKLTEEIEKQNKEKEKNKGKNGKNGGKIPTTVLPNRIASSTVPDTDYSTPVHDSLPRSYTPFSQPSRIVQPTYRSSYDSVHESPQIPRYPQTSRQNVAMSQQPKAQPKMLAFGALPGDEVKQPSASSSSKTGTQNAVYTPVAYQQPNGYSDSGNAIQSQQAAFLGGATQSRIMIGTKAKGEVTSGAILPGRFAVQISESLGSILAGSTIIFEPKTVYPNGKLEAYAIGVASEDYQRIIPVPKEAIGIYSTNGKVLKAKKPNGGFLNSIPGQMIVGGFQGAASRFLSTDSSTTITDSGTQTSSKAGSKGIADLGMSALQGGFSPLMRSLQPQQSDGKGQFSLEPGQSLLVKVLAPFTF